MMLSAQMALLGAILALAGCQNPQPAPTPMAAEAPNAAPATRPDLLKTVYQNSPAELECGDNLHKLEELLMMYAALHHELPPTLDKLTPLNDGAAPNLICPASKKPYVYVAAGLVADGDSRMLVLYDAEPAHNGKRQAIVLMPGKNGQAAFLDTAMITDEVLKLFHPARPAATRP